jgi:hypothetical protein
LDHYRQVWFVDFEYCCPPGCRPTPLCVVARELHSGRRSSRWLAGGGGKTPPYPTGPDVLFVAYYASAELGCHMALGWPMPARILDLFTEFRNLTNGRAVQCGSSLLGALTYFGLDAMAAVEKEEMRALALRGGPYSSRERVALTDYCQRDVDSLARLLVAMRPSLKSWTDFGQALFRGRYMAAVAHMEARGSPIDVKTRDLLLVDWGEIKYRLAVRVNECYGVYVPKNKSADCRALSFNLARWGEYLARHNIPWPRTPTGRLATDDDTFREMARSYPEVSTLRELRHVLSEMRLHDLAVGPDGRNRCLLSPFRSKTGRNQPSNSAYIFGPAVWLRSLIKPARGRAVAYIDWSAQELAIAARLSGDEVMQDAYLSNDPYLFLARQAGAVPADATKTTHAREREQFKVVSLGVLYGLSANGIATRLGAPPCVGRDLLRMHRETFRRFWEWSDAVEADAILTGKMTTLFGWTLHLSTDVNPRSLRNWPVQANAAEMMRCAAMLAVERGIELCAPIHDAFLIEADVNAIDGEVTRMRAAMREASELVLPGFSLRTDAKVVRYPNRYSDPRGREMWETVRDLLDEIESVDCDIKEVITTDGTLRVPPVVPPSNLFISSSSSS